MKNPEIYIFVALSFAFSLSWIVSRFSVLPIDLFNTSIGLLFAASTNLALIESNLPESLADGLITPALIDYAILLAFLQFVFGILIISSYFAHINLVKSEKDDVVVKVKEAVFYSWSSTVSLFSCYVMAIFFLHSSSIFAPVERSIGELNIIIERWTTVSHFSVLFWFLLFLAACVIRYWRKSISSIAKP
ncbi:hypothetical protein QUF50_06700 [Thiotrichales bacterium HSG1]|nr:hypothetical protein [Thiotrichales bacterium HSG1]